MILDVMSSNTQLGVVGRRSIGQTTPVQYIHAQYSVIHINNMYYDINIILGSCIICVCCQINDLICN